MSSMGPVWKHRGVSARNGKGASRHAAERDDNARRLQPWAVCEAHVG